MQAIGMADRTDTGKEYRMAKIELKKGSPECDIHNEFFKLHKDFGDPEDNDKYWDELNAAITGWTNGYKGTDFDEITRMMAVGLLGLLDGKLRRKKHDTHTL